MTKDIKSDNETTEWIFPEVDMFQEEENEFDDIISNDDIDDDDEDDDDEITISPVANKQNVQEQTQAQESVQEKTTELSRQRDLLQAIISKIKEPLAFLDDQIINILQDIIKKMTIKLINREISKEPELVKKIIEDLKSLIHSQNGLMNIYLSEEDYNRLQSATEAEASGQTILVDKTLTEGDIVISTKDTEVRALLNDRIDLLMGTLHD